MVWQRPVERICLTSRHAQYLRGGWTIFWDRILFSYLKVMHNVFGGQQVVLLLCNLFLRLWCPGIVLEELPTPLTLIIKDHPLLPWREQFWNSIDTSQAYHILLVWIEYSPGTCSLVGHKVGEIAEWSEQSVIFLISSVFKFLFLLYCTRELIHSLHWVGAGISGLG